MDVTAERGTLVKQALPRQAASEPYPSERLELVQLAAVASAQVQERKQARGGTDEVTVVGTVNVLPRRPRRRRGAVAVWVMFAGLAAFVAMIAVSLLSAAPAPAAPSAPPPHPVAAVPTSQAAVLGQEAGQRLRDSGGPLDIFVCQSAYSADAAASPGLLPPTDVRSTAQDDYIAGCMSDMSNS